jgi:antitoxin CptB
MIEHVENRRKRLLYRASYRGFREADLLIGGFAKANIASMNEAELEEFEALLEFSDREIYEWATGKRETPAHIVGPLFKRLQQFDIAGTIHASSDD